MGMVWPPILLEFILMNHSLIVVDNGTKPAVQWSINLSTTRPVSHTNCTDSSVAFSFYNVSGNQWSILCRIYVPLKDIFKKNVIELIQNMDCSNPNSLIFSSPGYYPGWTRIGNSVCVCVWCVDVHPCSSAHRQDGPQVLYLSYNCQERMHVKNIPKNPKKIKTTYPVGQVRLG